MLMVDYKEEDEHITDRVHGEISIILKANCSVSLAATPSKNTGNKNAITVHINR